METFLKEVALKLLENHPTDLDQITVVFNNRRSGLFLRKQFAEIKELENKSFFLPHTIGIDDLIEQLGGLEIVPNEFLLFELFDIHRKLDASERKFETFEEFIPFGEMMLSDFSEIDLYCVNANELFGNLYDIKEIGEWSITGEQLTPFQKKYLNFYKSLYTYYSELHDRLIKQDQAYGGMAYRHVAENIESMSDRVQCKKIYFVGFNALSECERKIIKHLTQLGIGTMITDGDPYYYDDPAQEAGFFLQKHKDDSDEKKEYKSHFNEKKKITIVSCPENVIQTKYTGQLLRNILADSCTDKTAQQTAIVLSDEALLPAMLNALPEEIKSANVTMGFPYTNSGIHALVLKLFSLYARTQKERFYHGDILDTLSDFFLCKLHGTSNLRPLLRDYQSQNKLIRSSINDIKKIGEDLNLNLEPILFLFEDYTINPDNFLSNLLILTNKIYESELLVNNIKELEAVGCLLQMTNYFVELQEKYHYIDTLQTLQKIYIRLAQHRSVSFYGEPLSGLQILGVLETRNLDFERIIMLSTNEGILPSGRTNNTLIPISLKHHFKMPTYSDKDAVYAYHFYRFLQRAKEIYLLYNAETESMGKGEASRFLMQIKEELAPKFPENIELTEIALSINNEIQTNEDNLEIEKSELIMSRLSQMAQNGFSPSALNGYNDCPIFFYYNNVLRISENNELEDDLDQSELGTIVHKILQDIYSIDADGNIKIQTLIDAKKQSHDRVLTEFESKIKNGQISEGKNHILCSVATTQIENLLEKEIQYLKSGNTIKIIQLEEAEDFKYPILNDVNIKGIADRIDYTQGHIRVIDYKTGHVDEKKELSYKTDSKSIPGKWFQVMIYAWLYCRKNNYKDSLISGIQPLRMLDKEFLPAKWNNEEIIDENKLLDFEELLKSVVSEIMDKNIPFKANPDAQNCEYCVNKSTCLIGKNKKKF